MKHTKKKSKEASAKDKVNTDKNIGMHAKRTFKF